MKIRTTFKLCYEKLGSRKKQFWALFLLKIFLIFFSLAVAYYFSNAISILATRNLEKATSCIIKLALFYMLILFSSACDFFLRQSFEKNVRVGAKKEIMNSALHFFWNKQNEKNIYNSAKVTEIIYSDANNITSLLFWATDFVVDAFSICITGVFLCYNDVVLFSILSIFYIVLAAFSLKYSRMLKIINEELRQETDEHFKLSRDILKNAKYICLSNSNKMFLKKYSVNLELVKKKTINQEKKSWILGFVSSILGYSWIILYLAYSLIKMRSQEINIAEIMLFLSYSKIYTSGITSIFNSFANLQHVLVSVERVLQMQLSCKINRCKDEILSFPQQINKIEICNLEFAYGDNLIFSNLSYKITEKIILITGKNGTGKTTLLNLLVGMLNSSKGDIYFNGHPVSKISNESLFNGVTYACQGDVIFDMSIRDNILSFQGHESITDEVLFDICKRVGIFEDIISLKDGFETPVSEIRDFSYGQKKKIQLARVYLRPSEIILLDEPLDGLDKQSQILFMDLLAEISKQKFIFVATHKPDCYIGKKEIIVL